MLIRGEQSLSIDIAMKLSRLIGASVNYWLNLQNAYDALIAEFKSEKELVEERKIFEYFDYRFFKENYGLPDLPRQKDEQIKALRTFLNVATLTVLSKRDMAVSFRSSSENLTQSSTVKANAMVQIATNKALKIEAPRFNKKKFEETVKYALTLTRNHEEFYPLIRKAFWEAGVILVIMPNIAGSAVKALEVAFYAKELLRVGSITIRVLLGTLILPLIISAIIEEFVQCGEVLNEKSTIKSIKF